MAPKADTPVLILRATPRGIIPATALDMETLAGIRFGTEMEAKELKAPPSGPLRHWWALMSACVKADPELISREALSKHILLRLGMVDEEEELLIGGSRIRRVPMSLRAFRDDQLNRLILAAERLIQIEIIPGVDIEALYRNAKTR